MDDLAQVLAPCFGVLEGKTNFQIYLEKYDLFALNTLV